MGWVAKGVEDILGQINQLVRERVKTEQCSQIEAFIHQYYGMVGLEDLRSRTVMDLYGAALSHWNFMVKRQEKELKLRVYNPTYDQHGWQSTHTIVEVIYDDMPFLVDSMSLAVNRQGLTLHLAIHIGDMKVQRDAEGQLINIMQQDEKRGKNFREEALIYLEVDRLPDESLAALRDELLAVIGDVTAAVSDWALMREKLKESIVQLQRTAPKSLAKEDLKEAEAFLHWLYSDHFTFLGCRDYVLEGDTGAEVMRAINDSGLGVLRCSPEQKVRELSALPERSRELILSPKQLLIVAKTNVKATVHRAAYTDSIRIKLYNDKGEVAGERLIIGLYTSMAYNSHPKTIPLIRHKVETVLNRSGLPLKGHAGKALLNILETFPRDDLLQATADEVYGMAMGILSLQERQSIRLFMRGDTYGRYYSCLVYVPRDRFNSKLRKKIQKILADELGGIETDFTLSLNESSLLCRIHVIVRINSRPDAAVIDVNDIEAKLVEAGRDWSDDLKEALIEENGESTGRRLALHYLDSFPSSYRDDFNVRTAVVDIQHIEQLSDTQDISMLFYRKLEDPQEKLHFKTFVKSEAVSLSEVLPMLENMGLKVLGERPYGVMVQGEERVWISDFDLLYEGNDSLDVDALRDIFHETFSRLWHHDIENDSFNRLVVLAGLTWRQITIIRAYTKYLQQIVFKFSQSYMEETLTAYPALASALVELFECRFHPENHDLAACTILEKKFLKRLDDEVSSLDHDTILRCYLELIKATLRTNYYQHAEDRDGRHYLSFKLDPTLISGIPLPRPQYEIFVYSPRVEGVHLRGAHVARGGLRWSDRREDFRTEILGLMKAQQVKNAVIVPQGAKGGFVAKQLPTGEDARDEILAEGIACYKIFISALLDITDNLVNNDVVPPARVVRYDEDDPYLVVAADKGTATFSDIANEVAEQYGFWLGDAFASGGSEGYDHKKMGITARGAWESVKRHFREINRDCQTEDFTVVGIGDMAGDVFGNGMLLSRHICLLAAFNHRHIFIDPTPDAEQSFQERERLFNLPRSTWDDYNPALISTGGGIFHRSAKFIRLSPEIQKMLDIEDEVIVPNDLINKLLKQPVDLLWNGGIGTYVKASSETHSDVGDRANDGLRVDATELRCKVIGEGGNLGMTQKARIEYALEGGACYTDFIDNSAGVDCSDHEVNIKILLNDIVNTEDMTRKQRNQLLSEMTEEVGQLCLLDNYRQTQAISTAVSYKEDSISLYSRQMRQLEKEAGLSREIEFLPDDEMLQQRKVDGRGFTSPELSVLMAYTKNALKKELLLTDVPEDEAFLSYLQAAFPCVLSEKFLDVMCQHRLRREIISTQVANAIVNFMGMTFIHRLYDETGSPIADIVRAYAAASEIFDVQGIWLEIEALDGHVSALLQMEMMKEMARLIRRGARWILRNRRHSIQVDKIVDQFKADVQAMFDVLPTLLNGEDLDHFNRSKSTYQQADVPDALAMKMASAHFMFSSLDIIEAAHESKFDLNELTAMYFTLNDRLSLGWFRFILGEHSIQNYWETLARAALRDDLDWQQRRLTVGVLSFKASDQKLIERVNAWRKEYAFMVERWEKTISELRLNPVLDFVMFFVVMRELIGIAQTVTQQLVDGTCHADFKNLNEKGETT